MAECKNMEKVDPDQMAWFIEQEKTNFVLTRYKDILDKVPDALAMLAVYNRQIIFWKNGGEKPLEDE